MSDISNQVLKKIKDEKITPVPRWHFVLKSSFIWFLFGINLLCGTIGTAIIIFLFANNDALGDKSLVTNPGERILLVIPIIWIVLTIVFIFIAYYNFKNTNGGYKYSVVLIFLLNIFVTSVLGFSLYITGGAYHINMIFNNFIPYYSESFDTRIMVWMRPEEGYLSGEIQSMNENVLLLKDFDENIWNIDIKNADVKHLVKLQPGEEIKIIGEVTVGRDFMAFEIRPWNGMRRGLQEN